MSLKQILLGLGIALALIVAIVLVVGHWSPGEQQEVAKAMSIEVGDHTVTVTGNYKNLTQESMADGMDIKVDGHEIAINADQLTVDGKTQVLDAGQDIEVSVDDKGAVNVKLVQSDAAGGGQAAQ
jgi:hypothetical protein